VTEGRGMGPFPRRPRGHCRSRWCDRSRLSALRRFKPLVPLKRANSQNLHCVSSPLPSRPRRPAADKPNMSTKTAPDAYTVRKIGHPHTPGFRVYVEKDGSPVSIFHDILLFAGAEQSIFNMVVEIPRWTNEKFEVSNRQTVTAALKSSLVSTSNQ
jgi:hypothetical protein